MVGELLADLHCQSRVSPADTNELDSPSCLHNLPMVLFDDYVAIHLLTSESFAHFAFLFLVHHRFWLADKYTGDMCDVLV